MSLQTVAADVNADDLVDAEGERAAMREGLDATDIDQLLRLISVEPTGHVNRMRLFAAESAAAADPDHPAHEWFIRRSLAVRQGFAAMLRQLQTAGLAHPDVDPEQFARQMVAVWDGLQLQWLAEPTFALTEEVKRAFRTLGRFDLVEARRAIEELAAGL